MSKENHLWNPLDEGTITFSSISASIWQISKERQLWNAAGEGNLLLVKKLCSDLTLGVNWQGDLGETPFYHACLLGKLEVVGYFLENPKVDFAKPPSVLLAKKDTQRLSNFFWLIRGWTSTNPCRTGRQHYSKPALMVSETWPKPCFLTRGSMSICHRKTRRRHCSLRASKVTRTSYSFFLLTPELISTNHRATRPLPFSWHA